MYKNFVLIIYLLNSTLIQANNSPKKSYKNGSYDFDNIYVKLLYRSDGFYTD